MLLESDLSPYLDVEETDRNPFFQYKDNLLGRMTALKQQYERFSDKISLNEKFHEYM